MKLRVSVSPLGGLKRVIQKRLELAVNDSLKKEIAADVVNDIQINARRGFGIKDGKRVPFAPLKNPGTIKNREYLERGLNNTARPYDTNLSNLSMSGQLIDSVDYNIKGLDIIIDASGEREPYKKLDGRPTKSERITNDELSKIHHKGDAAKNLPARPFIGLRDEMKDRIIIKIRESIRRSLEIVFNVKKGS